MGFIRRNIVFVISLAISAIVAGVLLWLLWGTHAKVLGLEGEVKEKTEFLSVTESGPYTINKANQNIVLTNRRQTEDAFRQFLAALAGNYGFPAAKTKGLECVQRIRDSLASWKRELTERKISVLPEAEDFSFSADVNSTRPPSEADTERLLKQMSMVNEIVRVLGNTGGGIQIGRISRLSAPGVSVPITNGLYRVESFELVIHGAYPTILSFCNNLQGDSNGLFIVRSVDVVNQAQAAEAEKEKTGVASAKSVAPPQNTAGKSEDVKQGKESRIAFKPHQLRATILVDLIEFVGPKTAGGT